jgi:hypothetical protein
MTIAVCDM